MNSISFQRGTVRERQFVIKLVKFCGHIKNILGDTNYVYEQPFSICDVRHRSQTQYMTLQCLSQIGHI